MALRSKLNFRNVMACSCPPLVFKHAVKQWPSLEWTPEFLSQVLGDKLLDCKISLIQWEEFQWEPDCLHLKITMQQYIEWLKGNTYEDNPLKSFDISKFSCYIDYKYMKDMFKEQPDFLKSVCWDVFGLNDRSGEHSTIWVGSHGTYTPCHQDTYGFNLVAQIQGRKRWYLFPPVQTDHMYPTRIPYEESSVYSEVNVRYPDLEQHPLFKKTTPCVIELVPGDVLYVPRHWWHFVESLEPSISINTWVPVVEDVKSRLDEAVCRLLYTCLSTTLLSETERLGSLNTGEELEDNSVNLQYIQKAVRDVVKEDDMVSPEHCIINQSDRQKKMLEKQSWDNFEKFLNKFENYPVTVTYLCGIDFQENLDKSSARKRKMNDENDINEDTAKIKNEKCKRTIGSEVISFDGQETTLHVRTKMSEEELQSAEKNKQEEKEYKKYLCIGNDTFDANKKLVTNDSNQDTFDIQIPCDIDKTNHSGVEIFAAKCFNFNEFLTFLKIVYDYEPNCQDIDSAMSEVQSSISVTASSVLSSISPSARETPSVSTSVSTDTSCDFPVSLNQSDTCSVKNPWINIEHDATQENGIEKQLSDFIVETGDKTVERFASYLGDTDAKHDSTDSSSDSGSELTVNIADVINSILNPNVIKHIGQILINKCKK